MVSMSGLVSVCVKVALLASLSLLPPGLGSPGRDRLSRVSKAPRVKASEMQKIRRCDGHIPLLPLSPV